MAQTGRIHTSLRIEELEPRTAPVALSTLGNMLISSHLATVDELAVLQAEVGVACGGVDADATVDGFGTGYRPPTEEEWQEMAGSLYITDDIQPLAGGMEAPSSLDWLSTQYMPPVGSQGSEGSCTCWAYVYYSKTFQEALEHDWDLSGATWSGGAPTPAYQDHIFSPDFVYHQINGGGNNGTWGTDAVKVMRAIGAASWQTMPYSASDHTTWPSEAAWREAPIYRGTGSNHYMDIQSSVDGLKDLLAGGNLAQIAIDASDMFDMATLDNFDNTSINHMQTIVGYDDTKSYTEEGETRYGAFKVVNSWGPTWSGDGCWWISYEALMQRVRHVYYYDDLVDYQPELLSVFEISHAVRGDCTVTIGLGDPDSPIQTKQLQTPQWSCDGDDPFPSNKMALDITEFVPDLTGEDSFFVKVTDGGTATTGTLLSFSIEHYSDYINSVMTQSAFCPDPPIATVQGGTVIMQTVLDSVGPTVVAQSPDGPISGPLSTITLTFSEAMDPTSFAIADDVVSFTGPAGDLKSEIIGYSWTDATTLDLTLNPQAAQGQYSLTVGPDILDAHGLAMDQDGDGILGELSDDTHTGGFEIGVADIAVSDSIGLSDDLAIDFGYVLNDGANGQLRMADVTIANMDTGDLVVNSIGVTGGADLSVTGNPAEPFTIGYGESVTVTVVFDPTSAGPASGTLVIESNDPDEGTVEVSLSAVGMTPLVLSKADSRVRFHDLDNDLIDLMFKGDGAAWVATTNGLSPLVDSNQDIGYIGFTGSTDRSMLMARDMDPKAGGNTLVLGTVETIGGESMGIIKLMQKVGVIQNTSFDIDGSLKMLQVLGGATNLDASVGGDASKVMMMGSLTNSTLDIGGAAGMVMIKRGADTVTIDVGTTLSKAMIFDGMTDSTLTVTGHTTMVMAKGGQTDSTLNLNGGVDNLMLFGGLDNTDVSATGNVKKGMIKDGMTNGSILNITGNATMVQIMGGMASGSAVTVAGDVSRAMLFGPKGGDGIAAGCTATFGSLSKMLMVKGSLAGTIDIEDSCVAGGKNSLIKVLGDLDGDLLAGMFGNVMVAGQFTGRIGDGGTAPGSDNTLRVVEPGGGGVVTPLNAFARYDV
ncbi:MAG: choice-of-anchor D domain-containing protein [Planctomycetes bacterium]|nr:choice-of-anchor D domain-containing protein [Planctomycetota bacterium]